MTQTFHRILFVALAAGLFGCRSNSHKYETPSAHEMAEVVPADLGVPAEQFPPMGAKSLSDKASVGRFPTGLSVVQITASTTESLHRNLQLTETAVDRASYWNQLLDGLPALREVRMQRSTALDPRGAAHGQFLRKAVDEGCKLCLMYAKTAPTDADAEYIACLWDAQAASPLAVFRSPVTIPGCRRDESDSDEFPKPREKHWLREADFRAETDLRQLVRDAIWDLAKRDQFESTTKPSPWKSDRPLLPRDPRVRILEIESGKAP